MVESQPADNVLSMIEARNNSYCEHVLADFDSQTL